MEQIEGRQWIGTQQGPWGPAGAHVVTRRRVVPSGRSGVLASSASTVPAGETMLVFHELGMEQFVNATVYICCTAIAHRLSLVHDMVSR